MNKKSPLAFVLVVAFAASLCQAHPDEDAPFINDEFQKESSLSPRSRHLQDSGLTFYEPQCSSSCSAWTLWSNKNFNLDQMVEISCDECIRMDICDGSPISLPNGIDIRGELDIPDGCKVSFETDFVIVQGKLHMAATSEVTGEEKIKFIMTGTGEKSFTPVGASSSVNIGKKSIAVVGGMLDIVGIPPDTPTWMKLVDVVKTSQLPALVSCQINGLLMEDDFDPSEPLDNAWSGSLGANFKLTADGTFRVFDRTSAIQGPQLDLRNIYNCIQGPNVMYTLSVKVKLIHPNLANGSPRSCSDDCLVLQSFVKADQEFDTDLWTETNEVPTYGSWHNLEFDIKFESIGMFNNEDFIYRYLRFRNVEEKVDIEIDDFKIRLQDSQDTTRKLSNPACESLLPDPITAETNDIFKGWYGNLQVSEETAQDGTQNKYFHLSERAGFYGTLIHNLPGECMVKNAVYEVCGDIRIHSAEPVHSFFEIRTNYASQTRMDRKAAMCDKNNAGMGWTRCCGETLISERLIENGAFSWRFQFSTFSGQADNADVDFDNLQMRLVHSPIKSIVLPRSIVGKWGSGAEILITSHTLQYDEGQVRKIAATPYDNPLLPDTVIVPLNASIIPPTTLKDDPNFAVEVALLDRNIVFEGDDGERLIGGHLIVFATPAVQQHIEGVEFINFGQQGILGRYPIHFHLSKSVLGATVKKNTVRESNQRCIVVHGTHDLIIEENVAYNTFGHCMILEDGAELNNQFIRNIGAYTRKPERIIRKGETDDAPTTFWITNTQNSFVGNCAAGSELNGFWFELNRTARAPGSLLDTSAGLTPRFDALQEFRDNIAHSNVLHGLKFYPFGYWPNEVAVFENFTSHRNHKSGISFFLSRYVKVLGGNFADNERNIDFDVTDAGSMQNAVIIGMSSSYQKVLEREIDTAGSNCDRIGTQLHTFARNSSLDGTAIKNVSFSSFGHSHLLPTCYNSFALHFDMSTRDGAFEHWTTIEGVTVEKDDGSIPLSLCSAEQNGVDDVVVHDLDGSLSPSNAGLAAAPAAILSTDPKMLTFLDPSKCSIVSEHCYRYCEQTCLRTVTYTTNQYGTEDVFLVVTDVGSGNAVTIPGHFWDEPTMFQGFPDDFQTTKLSKHRTYPVHLPPGRIYQAAFFDSSNEMIWPTYVQEQWEDKFCEGALETDAVTLIKPGIEEEDCKELIRNGGADDDSSIPMFWSHDTGGIKVATNEGRSGNAFSDTNPGSAFNKMGQWLNTLCLEKMLGRQYVISAWIKLEDPNTGAPVTCTHADYCPEIEMRVYFPSPDGRSTTYITRMNVAREYVRPDDEDGWRQLQEVLTIDKQLLEGSAVYFFIERDIPRTRMLLDDISVRLIEQSDSGGECEGNLVFNHDLEYGNSSHWGRLVNNIRESDLEMWYESADGAPGHALAHWNRRSKMHSPMQFIRTGCMESGDRFMVTSRFQLRDSSSNSTIICDNKAYSGETECPEMELSSYVDIGLETAEAHHFSYVAKTDFPSSEWSYMSGIFYANEVDERADRHRLQWDEVYASHIFIVDDIVVEKLPSDCSNLIYNGDASANEGRTAAFWERDGQPEIDLPKFNGNSAFRLRRELKYHHGMRQYIDVGCLVEGEVWKFVGKFRIFEKDGTDRVCNPTSTMLRSGCPAINIRGYDAAMKLTYYERFYSDLTDNWVIGEFNLIETSFTVTNDLASANRVSVAIRYWNIDWVVVVDDMKIIRT